MLRILVVIIVLIGSPMSALAQVADLDAIVDTRIELPISKALRLNVVKEGEYGNVRFGMKIQVDKHPRGPIARDFGWAIHHPLTKEKGWDGMLIANRFN